MILQFNHNNEWINITLNKKHIKNIYIKLNSNNEIVVSAPINSSQKLISEFINKYLDKFIKLQKENFKKNIINLEDKTFYLFGKLESYELLKILSIKNEDTKFLVFRSKKYKINKKSIFKIILLIYKKELELYLLVQQQEIERLMNVKKHKISIRLKKNAWASNYTEKAHIIYNIKLAAYSHEIINYVIIHELSHSTHPNHSKKFWEEVINYDPNFKINQTKLKSLIYF